jgi:Ca2+:H+ antiporter
MEMYVIDSDDDDYPVSKPQASRRTSATPTLVNAEPIPLYKAVALGTLLLSAFVVSLSAEATVSSLTHVISNTPLSTTFLSLILLPLLGNSAELGTAVTVARTGNIDLAINVAVGSAIQVASGMTPIMILLGWAMGKEVGLSLTGFELAALLISVVIVGACMIGSRSTWMFGGLLCILYGVFGIGAYFMPNEP